MAYNLNQRVRQELAFPAVTHLYTWLLQGAKPLPPAKILCMTNMLGSLHNSHEWAYNKFP